VIILNQNKRGKHNIDIVVLITLIFITLKLTNYIQWSWAWVFSPIWITVLFFGLIFGIILVGGRIVKGKW